MQKQKLKQIHGPRQTRTYDLSNMYISTDNKLISRRFNPLSHPVHALSDKLLHENIYILHKNTFCMTMLFISNKVGKKSLVFSTSHVGHNEIEQIPAAMSTQNLKGPYYITELRNYITFLLIQKSIILSKLIKSKNSLVVSCDHW